MSVVWADASIKTPSELLVMLAIADHANEEGWCFPSIGRLARMTRMSDRGVQKIIQRLVETGKLRRHEGGKGARSTNTFIFPASYALNQNGGKVFTIPGMKEDNLIPMTEAEMEQKCREAQGRTPFTLETSEGRTSEQLRVNGETLRVNPSANKGEQAVHPNHHRTIIEPSVQPLPGMGEISKKKGSIEEVKDFCRSIEVPEMDADYFFNKWEGSGWRNGGQPIRDWKSTIRSWKAAGYLPSQKGKQQITNGPNGAQTVVNQKEYERVIERLRKLGEGFFPAYKGEQAALRKRRDELRKELGIVI